MKATMYEPTFNTIGIIYPAETYTISNSIIFESNEKPMIDENFYYLRNSNSFDFYKNEE